MSSLPLTFNNGQTETTSEISVVTEGRDSTKRNLIDIPFLPTNEDITRVLQNKPREKSYLVTTLIKDGVDENNRPLYKREIRSFNSVSEAKTFKEESYSKLKDKKNYEITKYKPRKSLSFTKLLSYLIVLLITFVALLVIIDTFSAYLYQLFPSLELFIFSLFEILKDIKLFIKDLV